MRFIYDPFRREHLRLLPVTMCGVLGKLDLELRLWVDCSSGWLTEL